MQRIQKRPQYLQNGLTRDKVNHILKVWMRNAFITTTTPWVTDLNDVIIEYLAPFIHFFENEFCGDHITLHSATHLTMRPEFASTMIALDYCIDFNAMPVNDNISIEFTVTHFDSSLHGYLTFGFVEASNKEHCN